MHTCAAAPIRVSGIALSGLPVVPLLGRGAQMPGRWWIDPRSAILDARSSKRMYAGMPLSRHSEKHATAPCISNPQFNPASTGSSSHLFGHALNEILDNNTDQPSQRLAKAGAFASSLGPNGSTPSSAVDVNVAILIACQTQRWRPDHSIIKALIACSVLDRDWDLLNDLIPHITDLPPPLNVSLWQSLLPILAHDRPHLALDFVHEHILSKNQLFVLADRSIALSITEAARKTRNRAFLSVCVELCQSHDSSLFELRRAITLLSAASPFLFSQSECTQLARWLGESNSPVASQLKAEYTLQSALSESNLPLALETARTLVCVSGVVSSLLSHILSHSYPPSLQVFSHELFVRVFLDLRNVAISEPVFLGFLRSAPPSYPCDEFWYRLNQDRQFRISRGVALKLFIWTAHNSPTRFSLLMSRLSSDRLRFLGTEKLSDWKALFCAFRHVRSVIRKKDILSLHAMLDVKRGDKALLACVEVHFASHFMDRSSPDHIRMFIVRHLKIFPPSQKLANLVRASFAPVQAYSILVELWTHSHSRIPSLNSLSSQQFQDWFNLHYTVQALSSHVSPHDCHAWTRRIQELERLSDSCNHATAPTMKLGSSDNMMMSLIRSFGRCGDDRGLNRLALSGHWCLEDPNVRSVLVTAFTKTDQIKMAEQVVTLLDPKSEQGSTALISIMSAQVRNPDICKSMVTETAHEIYSEGNCNKRNKVGALNVQAMALRAQGCFLDAIQLCMTNCGPINAGTLTITISCAIHAIETIMQRKSSIVHELWLRWTGQPEKLAEKLKRDVYLFVLNHSSTHVHRYHIHLLLKLILGSPPEPSWNTALELLKAMDLGTFSGVNTRTGHSHWRPTKTTLRLVHSYMYARLAHFGLTEPNARAAMKIEHDPNLYSDRLQQMSEEHLDCWQELAQMAHVQHWIEAHLKK